MTDPISTTNITGFFMSVRGLSFLNESRTAPPTIPPVQRDCLRSRVSALKLESGTFTGDVTFSGSIDCVVMGSSKHLSGVHQQVLEDRAQAERGEKGKCADDQDHGSQQEREKWRRYRKGACGCGHEFLASQVSGDCEDRDVLDKSTQQRGEA